MSGEIILGGLQLGVKAMQIWAEYQAELLSLQAARAAEGRSVTREEVDALIAITNDKLASNRVILESALAAQIESENEA